ncbi:MAG: hypothetical protein KF699_04730 [Phycisphaeraceae bacterium]|nr:hypothetical protein [Phycisphaeraceae bacterium]
MTQTQALITGEKSHADRFEEGIVQLLVDQNSDATAWRVDATFGVFGSLPLLGVTFDDAFVLLDAAEGNLDGPFDLDSPLDATVLLSHHAAYSTGTTVRHVNTAACLVHAGLTRLAAEPRASGYLAAQRRVLKPRALGFLAAPRRALAAVHD